MIKSITKSQSKRRGATMVEFSLTFILFLFLVLAAFEGGRAIWSFVTLTHGAREGARFAMVHGANNPLPDSDIATRVKNQVPGLDKTGITVTTTWADVDKTPGTGLAVRVLYNHPMAFTTLLGWNTSLSIGMVVNTTVLN